MTDELHDLAPLYVLDGLDEAERVRFEAHLAGCPACRAEVAELSETLAALGDELAVEPPPDIKSRVMEEIVDTPRRPESADEVEPPAQSGGRAGPEVVDLAEARESRRRRLARRASVWLTSAAVIAVVAAGLVLANRDADPVDPYAELVAAEDAEVLELDGEAGRLTVVYSPGRDRVGVSSDSLPAPGDGSTYALWFVFDDGVAPAALFEPDDGELRVTLPVDDVEPAGFGVTVEPDGGSPQPTGDILYLGERGA